MQQSCITSLGNPRSLLPHQSPILIYSLSMLVRIFYYKSPCNPPFQYTENIIPLLVIMGKHSHTCSIDPCCELLIILILFTLMIRVYKFETPWIMHGTIFGIV